MSSIPSLTSNLRYLLLLAAFASLSLYLLLPSDVRTVHSQPVYPHPERKREVPSNYDIRTDKRAADKILSFRSREKKTAVDIADIRETVVRGERALKNRVQDVEVAYNPELQHAEVITPKTSRGRSFLTRPSSGKRSNLLKQFLDENAELTGLKRSDIPSLRTVREHSNRPKSLSFVELKQEINGIPVFRGGVKAGFTASGELVRVVNGLAPGLDRNKLSRDFGDPVAALTAAVEDIENTTVDLERAAREITIQGVEVKFGEGPSAPTAEKIYFPTELGVAVAAWRVLIWQRESAFYVIVDAASGTVLWRKNITEEQTQPATYSVYADPDAWMNVAQSPFPFSPGPLTLTGAQGAAIPRTSVTRIGNEPPFTFNQLGWLPDGATITKGNAVHAGLDRSTPNGIDPNSEAVASDRNFSFDFDPLNPNTGIGQAPLPATQEYPGTQFQQGVITQLFYVTNWFHDATYLLGFDEAAGNFQEINFTGQGLGGDPVSAQAQDFAGVNNANFSTPADGTPGTMQMYLFTSHSPNIDGGLDNTVVIHELTHGLSNRLHGDGFGLFNDMSRGMGEGWSDFFALSLLSRPNDPLDGIYTIGSYVMYVGGQNSQNAYYGIRRFPTAIRSSTGGPQGRPHNPLTFADLDQTQFDVSDGAFAPRTDGSPDQVHRVGEIWCNALWEVRARMISRLGWEAGNRQVMQLVVDGMKLSPLSPTFISGRDAIVAAAFAGGTEDDLADIWAGFAIRGIGAGASVQNPGGTSTGGTGTARVTESFELPDLQQTDDLIVSDASGDGDGYPEPGESVTLTIPVTNATGRLAVDVAVSVSGGGSASYGVLGGISTESREISYVIPNDAACGSSIPITLELTSSLGTQILTRNIFIGRPGETEVSESFDNVTAPDLPAGWKAEAISGGVNFVLSSSSPDTPPHSMFALDPSTVGGGTDLTSPAISVTTPTASLTFRNSYLTEERWDGGVLEISIAGGPYQDILAAGGSFVQNGYNDILGAGKNNPVGSRAGWTGNSGGYLTTVVQLPERANGRIVHLKWRFGADDNTAPNVPSPGWRIDSISLAGAGFVKDFVCSLSTGGAKASISGRLTTPSGGGLRGATVILGGPGGVSRRVTSSSLGFYQFDDIDAGHTYSISVISKRFRFTPRELQVSGNLADIDFVGVE